MGTSTIFIRFNDLSRNPSQMTKQELKEFDLMVPYAEEKKRVAGWRAEMELHNGNFHPLIWWH